MSEVCVKLPSGEVSMQSDTPCVFQKIDVRAPSGTVVGVAQISTLAVIGAVVVAFGGVVPPTVVLVTVVFVPCPIVIGAGVGFAVVVVVVVVVVVPPTW